ncbi:GNAT family N-acetyltransferase [Streptomyces radicis]|uniref:N-acetyltransferase n=1 Tax=Streptomyces radicis TaxID=1750517 RepID=A0A3A9VWY3_9ACTN|nr:GNAT family protein [Streptomyces radicis]RKN05259.1 N-acetyltransferase [Streptomyces radicis]RKN16792.1 N-acetyltransferase [Streptomyces radicis]
MAVGREERAAGLEAQLGGGNIHRTLYLFGDGRPGPIGMATLAVDHALRTAEFFLCLGAEGRGRGLAAVATRLVVRHGFETAALRNVLLTVLAPNVPAIRAYEAAGFRLIGRRRDSGSWDGHPCDELLMDAVPADIRGRGGPYSATASS